MSFLGHKYHVNIPPKKVLKGIRMRINTQVTQLLDREHLREIKASNCNVI